MNPRYIADYGLKKFHVMDRDTKDIIMNLSHDEFSSLNWMKESGSMIIESSHGARTSRKSKAQPLETKEKAQAFYELCEKRGVELKFSPEKSLFKWRETYYPEEKYKKSDEIDLKIWNAVITDKPFIWDTALLPENVEFIDSDEDAQDWIDSGNVTKYKAGRIYNNQLNDTFRLHRASNETYKKCLPGQRAYETGCIDLVAERLSNHNSANGKIKNGVAQLKIDGHDIELSLLDIMGYERNAKNTAWKDPEKATQYVSCMMLLIDFNGEFYINALTKKPMGYKDIKQFGMCSTPFHQKPGFARPSLFWFGIRRCWCEKILQKYYGVKKIDYQSLEQHELMTFVRNTCRVAYEQTLKAMKQYLDTPKSNLEKFAV